MQTLQIIVKGGKKDEDENKQNWFSMNNLQTPQIDSAIKKN